MVVNEEDVVNIMGGMEHAGGIKLNDHKRKLKNRFEICRKLGQGTYGKVQLGVNKETGQQVAIKTIKKSKIETEADLVRIRREIQIMSSVQHPNIIHIYEVFENKEKMVLVMEIAAGGELYDYLRNKTTVFNDRKSLEEKEARRIFRQIATAVYYCHKHNICHRDLKLENILLDAGGAAKIADFGLSNVFDRKNLLSTFCGSPLYASPEIVRGSPYQGPEVDCWSLGVLLYTLVYGAMPFDGSNFKRLVKQITTGDYYEPKHPSTASSLIRGMLTVKAEERANIVDICTHWWVNDGYKQSCLDEAEYLASLTPVRLDLLLSLTRQENRAPPEEVKSEVATPTNKHTPSIDIEEIPAGMEIPAGVEECDVSLSEEPNDDKSPVSRRRADHKRKLDERASLVEPDVVVKKQDNKASEDSLQPPPPPPRVVPPEPMECLVDQVYERPRDRKESSDAIDIEKTPKVRRKNKSSGDLVVYNNDDFDKQHNDSENKRTVATPQSKRKQEDGRKTPRSHEGRKSRQSKSKTPDKANQKHKEEKMRQFERPEPQPSPRPPRQMFTPDLSPEKIFPMVEPATPAAPPAVIPTQPSAKEESILPTEPKSVQPEPNQFVHPQHAEQIMPVKSDPVIPFPPFNQPIPPTLHETEILHQNNELEKVQGPKKESTVAPPPLPEKKRKSNIFVRDPNIIDSEHINNDNTIHDLLDQLVDEPINQQTTFSTQNCDFKEVKSEPLNKSENKILEADNNISDIKLVAPVKLIDSEPLKKDNISNVSVVSKPKQSDITTAKEQSIALPVDPNTSSKDVINLPQVSSIPVLNSVEPSVSIQNKVSVPSTANVTQPEVKSTFITETLQEPPKPKEILTPQVAANNLTAKPNIENQPSLKEEVKLPTLSQPTEPKLLSPTRTTQPIVTNHVQPAEVINSSCPSPSVQRNDKSNVKVSINNLPKLVIKQNSLNTDTSSSKERIMSTSPEKAVASPIKEEPKSPLQPLHAKSNDSLQPIKLMKQDSPKSLINNIPKPFKPESEKPKDTPTSPQITKDDFKIQTEVSKPKLPEPIKEPVVVPKPVVPETPKPRYKPIDGLMQTVQNGPTSTPSPVREVKVESVKTSKSTDSVGSAISLSDDEKDVKPQRVTPSIMPKQNGPNLNYSTISPANSSSSVNQKKGTEKRDSKVIKAAAYWNNYIGEVTSKARPPSNVKQLDKPKKIVSAGIGERGLKELTNAFEQGKPMVQEEKITLMRRNSKKMNVETCNPGLRVNDAKSVFEKKFQQPIETPRLTRRGSSTLDKPRYGQPRDQESDEQNTPSPQTIPNDSKTKVFKKDDINIITNNNNNSNVKSNMNTIPFVKTPKESRKLPAPSTEEERTKKKSPSKSPAREQKSRSPTKAVKDLPLTAQPSNSFTPATSNESKSVEVNKSLPAATKPSQPSVPAVLDSTLSPTVAEAPVKPPTSPKPSLKRNDLGKTTSVNTEIEKAKAVEENNKSQSSVSSMEISKEPEVKIEPIKEPVSEPVKMKEPEKIEPVLRPVRKEVTKIIFKNKPKTEEKRFNGFDRNNNSSGNVANNIVSPVKEPETPKLFIKTVKIKSPEPDKKETITPPEPSLSDIRSSLKKVPHAASNLNKSGNDLGPDEASQANGNDGKENLIEVSEGSQHKVDTKEQVTEAMPEKDLSSVSIASDSKIPTAAASPKKERIIPITFVNENVIPRPYTSESEIAERASVDPVGSTPRAEHHIPILVEGGPRYPARNEEDMERLDNFNTNTINRRRWGSRKKRMSSAFSDSSMSDDDALGTPLSGLQKYTSYGKHGLSEQPLFRLKKTRPPFSVEKTDSFSSGEDDDFDDDGFQEMTAENLFSTLLSRVKSLTRRIHDEHDDQMNWQLTRHGPPKLNPGGTHARLERTAQRNSIKRTGEPARQYSSYDEPPSSRSYDNTSSRYSTSNYTPTKIYNRSNSVLDNPDPRYSSSGTKRYDDNDAASDFSGSISITSSQRLRPGYLPPPANHNHPVASSKINNTSLDVSDIHAQNLTHRPESNLERNIPINVQSSNYYDSPGSSKPGTPVPTPGVYMKHMKPFNLNSYEPNDRLDAGGSSDYTADPQRRVSRFLRPDFYDIPKEDSIYAKMKEIEDEDKRKPRFLRQVQNRGRETLSGRSTPLDYSSYSEEVPRSETRTPFGDSSVANEGVRQQHYRSNINSLHNNHQHKRLEDSGIEQDVLLAGVNKLRRQGIEHSTEVSEISDGYRTPDSESITSDVFGAPDLISEGDDSFQERLSQSGLLNRVERKISRGSMSHEGVGDDATAARYTSSRPVSRRSISRELFDLKYSTGRDISKAVADYKRELTSPITRRYSRHSSNTDYTSTTDRHNHASDYLRSSSVLGGAGASTERTRSLSQTRALGAISPTSSLSVHSPGSAYYSAGSAQNDIIRRSPLTAGGRLLSDDGGYGAGSTAYGGSLKDRNRQSWRRISVPERGKDFNTLPRKYNRLSTGQNFDVTPLGSYLSRPQNNTRTLPPPSPVIVRRSSTQESFRRPPGIRKSATLEHNQEFSDGSGYNYPYYDPPPRVERSPSRMAGPTAADMMMYGGYTRGSREVTPVQSRDREMFIAGLRGGDSAREVQSYGRRTPTYPLLKRNSVAAASGSSGLYRDGSFDNFNGANFGGGSAGTGATAREETPNFSRYSSILDDKHDWGFSTLSRRNSRSYTGF